MTLRLGIVGCGAVAVQYHLPAVAVSPDVRLTVLCDADVERARSLAAATGATATNSLDDLAEAVDAAIVAVPNHLHAPVSCALLLRGVHVLVEKPMALNAGECDAMIAAARESDAVLAVGHDFRFFPVAQYAHELFASGLMGAVERVDVRQSATGRWPYASDYIFSPAAAGGGVLIDFGVHMLDLVAWWFGDNQLIAYRDDAAGGVESECELELELASGAPVSIELSRTRSLRDTVVAQCAQGSVEVGIFEPALVRLRLPGPRLPLAGDVEDAIFAVAPLTTIFTRQLADFADAITSGRTPLVPGPEGRRPVATVEAAYAARRPLRRPWDYPDAYAALGLESQ